MCYIYSPIILKYSNCKDLEHRLFWLAFVRIYALDAKQLCTLIFKLLNIFTTFKKRNVHNSNV